MILNVFNIMSPFIDCDVTADNKSLHDRLREKQDERDSDRTLAESRNDMILTILKIEMYLVNKINEFRGENN